MRTIVALASLAALIQVAPAWAKDLPPISVKTKSIADKPSVTLDPAMAHVLLRSDSAIPLFLMKVPTAGEQAAYDALRQAELVKAKAKYVRKLAAYQRDVAAAAKMPKGNLPIPEKPVEPTEANFKITPIGMMATVSIGPMYRFAKSKERSTYLQAVTPGWYRVYGFVAAPSGQPAVGSCFCMGSVMFEARAGEIVDLGLVADGQPPQQTQGDSSQPVDLSARPIFRRLEGEALDPRLTAYKVVPASFRPTGKLPNYLGITISRMPAMPGVMRYDRDRIVDLTGRAD